MFKCFKKTAVSPKMSKRGILKSTSFKQVCPEPPPSEIKYILKHPSMLFAFRDKNNLN